jgi:hypothetical protein
MAIDKYVTSRKVGACLRRPLKEIELRSQGWHLYMSWIHAQSKLILAAYPQHALVLTFCGVRGWKLPLPGEHPGGAIVGMRKLKDDAFAAVSGRRPQKNSWNANTNHLSPLGFRYLYSTLVRTHV